MPDTMIQTEITPVPAPASCGVMDGFRSPQIGKLVLARAQATKEIKSIIKDKTADIQGKPGGRSFKYSYADLASVMEAVEDALATQELAVFQTLQDRKGATFLITTLAHSSDQWVASELKVSSADLGPQIFGSALSYARRYAVLAALALAPEADTDDDGKAAQDRADQQARQRPAQRAEQSRRMDPAPQAQQAPQQPPAGSGEPVHMPLSVGQNGPLVNKWTKWVLETLEGKSIEWRYTWLALHTDELAEVHHLKPDNWKRIDEAVVGDIVVQEAAE